MMSNNAMMLNITNAVEKKANVKRIKMNANSRKLNQAPQHVARHRSPPLAFLVLAQPSPLESCQALCDFTPSRLPRREAMWA
jgi:hypothetical protein